MQRETTAMAHIEFMAQQEQRIDDAWQARRLRGDLTEAEKAEALRIGRLIDRFKSAGATRNDRR
jgi:hypothetical protein